MPDRHMDMAMAYHQSTWCFPALCCPLVLSVFLTGIYSTVKIHPSGMPPCPGCQFSLCRCFCLCGCVPRSFSVPIFSIYCHSSCIMWARKFPRCLETFTRQWDRNAKHTSFVYLRLIKKKPTFISSALWSPRVGLIWNGDWGRGGIVCLFFIMLLFR